MRYEPAVSRDALARERSVREDAATNVPVSEAVEVAESLVTLHGRECRDHISFAVPTIEHDERFLLRRGRRVAQHECCSVRQEGSRGHELEVRWRRGRITRRPNGVRPVASARKPPLTLLLGEECESAQPPIKYPKGVVEHSKPCDRLKFPWSAPGAP